MTNLQLKILHIAKRQLAIEEADWRTILRSIAQVQSSKELTQVGFEDVMAYLESRGYRQVGKAESYWRDVQDARGTRADRRQVFKIEELIAQTSYQLPGLCRRFSHARTEEVTRLTPREAHGLIEMLKNVICREQKRAGHLDPFPDSDPSVPIGAPADASAETLPSVANSQPELW